MRILKPLILTLIVCIQSAFLFGQEKFKVVERETGNWKMIFDLVNEQNEVIRTLDTNKYYPISLNDDNFGYFAIFGMFDSSGWYAIDSEEKILFKVYNTSIGEPNPDHLIENKIRIVDQFNKIGFANEKGEIIIPPQFEIASHFSNNKAIIGVSCEKVPWDNHEKENGCNHYSIICKQHGYIDEKGTLSKMTVLSIEEIAKEIKWKPKY